MGVSLPLCCPCHKTNQHRKLRPVNSLSLAQARAASAYLGNKVSRSTNRDTSKYFSHLGFTFRSESCMILFRSLLEDFVPRRPTPPPGLWGFFYLTTYCHHKKTQGCASAQCKTKVNMLDCTNAYNCQTTSSPGSGNYIGSPDSVASLHAIYLLGPINQT